VSVRNAVVRFVRGDVPWVYVYGLPGNGKTHLAAAAANHLLAQGRAVLFVTALELLAVIRDGFDSRRVEDLTGVCQRAPWLVVDDLGAERRTDGAAEVLSRIFNARYVARAHTLVASNVRPGDLAEPRLRSRFLDVAVCHRVPNGGDDYRQGKDRAGTDR
jgi:DNA replication protein DnaC